MREKPKNPSASPALAWAVWILAIATWAISLSVLNDWPRTLSFPAKVLVYEVGTWCAAASVGVALVACSKGVALPWAVLILVTNLFAFMYLGLSAFEGTIRWA